jgi:NAD(P)-dependent dehydrogenase (short-subunit alcohol dehydrogenase family)
LRTPQEDGRDKLMPAPRQHGVALVTGSSSGIGKAISDRLAKDGWRVYGGSRRGAAVTAIGSPAWTPISLDVTAEQSVREAVSSVLEADGRIDLLVHCAGISVAGSIEDVTIAEAERQLATNYFGAVRVVQSVLPAMRKAGRGRIIIIGSIGGLIGLPFIGHYSASKFALDGMVQALRIEIAPLGVEATILHPGDIQTDISTNQIEGERTGQDSVYHERFKATVGAYDKAVRDARKPDVIADAVAKILRRRRLPARGVAGPPNERGGGVRKARVAPRGVEALVKKTYDQ